MKRTCCVVAGLALAGVGLASPSHAETLDNVLATAYNSNPTLMARRAQLRATDEGVPQALSSWRPTVTLTGDIARGDYFSDQNLPPLSYNIYRTQKDYTAQISQPLYRGGRTKAATNQAEAAVLATRAQLEATEAQVLLTAATSYLNVVRDEAVVKLSINNEQVLRRQMDAARERFRVGEITRTDVSQSEARLSQATADRVAAEGNLQSSRAGFIDVVGRAPESPEAPKAAAEVPNSFDTVKADTLQHNPNVVSADWVAKGAKEGIDLVMGELLPTLSATGTYSRFLDATGQHSQLQTSQAMLTLSVPLYEGGGTYARLRAQKHTYGQRMLESDQTRRDALQTATQSWETLMAARARVQSYTAQIAANELALAGVEEEAKVGARTVLDTLNAEQELFQSRVNLVTARHDEMVAAFQLRSALGEMTAEALKLPVDIYDPRQHYDDVRNQWIGAGIGSVPGYED
jgi:outer membrane protein